jgi:hypothetical protein
VLNFTGNRLASLRLPDGTVLTISRHSNGTLQLNRSGIPLVTLTPDWDKQSVQKFYRLKFADRTAILKMGQRPVVVREKGNRERVVLVPALTGQKSLEGEKTIEYSSACDEIIIGANPFQWEKNSMRLCKNGFKSYSFPVIRGITCIRETDPTGAKHLRGVFRDLRMETEVKELDNGHISIVENVVSGVARGKPKKGYLLDEQGHERIVSEYRYDENGALLENRDYTGAIPRIHRIMKNKIVTYDLRTGVELYEKEFDTEKRLKKFATSVLSYQFNYIDGRDVIEIIRLNKISGGKEIFLVNKKELHYFTND